jgi:hypothetical protein
LLTRAGLGHLLPTGTALLGGGEVGKLHCLKITNTLMDKCEQRHGAKLTTIVIILIYFSTYTSDYQTSPVITSLIIE